MNDDERDRLRAVLNEHEAELVILRALVTSMFDEHPMKARVVARFQREVEGYAKSAPPGTDPEFVVEVLARLQLHLSGLSGT